MTISTKMNMRKFESNSNKIKNRITLPWSDYASTESFKILKFS